MSIRSPGPLLTTLGGALVIGAAIVIMALTGRPDVRAIVLVPTGGLLVLNGVLRGRRAQAPATAASSPRARGAWFSPIRALLAVALLEVAINRIAVPMLRPLEGTPPWWHTSLDYLGLFLFYFTGVLAALLIASRCADAVRDRGYLRGRITHAIAAVAALLAAVPLVISAPASHSLVLEATFALAVLGLVASSVGRGRDLGGQIGLPIVAAPLIIHTVSAIGAHLVWPENTFDGPGTEITRVGVIALAIAALASPYCFAPRPFTRAVTRPVPVVIAMTFAAIGAIIARAMYPSVAEAAALAIGVELSQRQADPRLALYLLAVATLVWTLASCAVSAVASRRQVGAGLALVVLGGYGFRWPHHYLLPLLGVMLIADALRRVRDDELTALPLTSEAPPVPDPLWATYVGALCDGLKRSVRDVHSLTTRGEAGLVSSVIVGDADGLPLRVRIERIEGAVLALDVVVGREIDEHRAASLTLWAVAARGHGANPAGPPASPLFRTGDASFDERFKTRGSALVLRRVLDDELRNRAVTTLDGWLALWDGEGLRYRVYPGRGAPLDHPIPLSDLALGRSATHTERMLAVVDLVVEIARRGVPPTAALEAPEPQELET